jgi:hypothetical protein
MASNYTPANWYWVVGGSTTQVWSSARAAYVPLSDATYTAWLARGFSPTKIDSEASLAGVFAQQYPAGWSPQVPVSISNFQAKAALYQVANTGVDPTYPAGSTYPTMLDVVNAAVAATGGLAAIAWNNGFPLYRSGPLVTQVAATMGATSAHMDAFFIGASAIMV